MLLEQEALEREPAEPGLIKKPFRHLLLKFLLTESGPGSPAPEPLQKSRPWSAERMPRS